MKQITAIILTSLSLTFALVAPCHNAGAQTQTEMNIQAASEYKKADAELNAVYKKLLPLLSQSNRTKLIKSQRAWIAYRDAEMEFAAAGYSGGSMSPMVRYNAATRVTKARLSDLHFYLDDYSHR